MRVTEIIKDAGLELRKWITNDSELRKILIGEEEIAKLNKVLVVQWNVIDDCFVYDFIRFLDMIVIV